VRIGIYRRKPVTGLCNESAIRFACPVASFALLLGCGGFARKDERIKRWCKDTSKLTGQNWQYLKVLEDDFKKYQFADFENIVNFLGK